MNIRDMDLNLLTTLNALIGERSVSRAAEHLDLSQPAVSNALRRLRQLLDDPLLVRSGNTMVPTPRALEIQPVVQRALDELNTSLFGANTFDPTAHHEPITIATTDGDIAVFAAALHQRLRQAGAPATLRFLNLDPSYARALLESGAVALAVGTMELAPDVLQQMRLADDTFCVVTGARHDLAKGTPQLRDYLAADHVLVAPLGGTPVGIIDTALAKRGHKRRIRMVVPSFHAALTIAAQTDLVATLPLATARAALDAIAGDGNLIIREPDYLAHGIRIRAFWHSRFHKTPQNVWLRRELRAAFGSR